MSKTKTRKAKRRPKARKVINRTVSNRTILAGFDTEGTGSDYNNGCKPYYISIYYEDPILNEQVALEWEWPVDPLTRQPQIPDEDLVEVQTIFDDPRFIFVIHNSLFDVAALKSIGLTPPPWTSIHDTMLAHHLYKSGDRHGLKDCCIHLLNMSDTDEHRVEEVVKDAIKLARKLEWNLAEKGHDQFPGVSKAPWWKLDMWVPRAIADYYGYPEDHEYRTVTAKYGMMDAIRVLKLWEFLKSQILIQGRLSQYLTRKAILPVIEDMTTTGMSFNQKSLDEALNQFSLDKEYAKGDCQSLSHGLDNPGSPKQLQKAVFDDHELPILKMGKRDPSIDKFCVEEWLEMDLPQTTRELLLGIQTYRKTTKACEALTVYNSAGVETADDEWKILYPGINPTGTDTTRKSSSDPPAQNISKKEGFNLRRVFGPRPGRVWYASDYSNIELRIFAHASGDKRLIQAFKDGYSVHLIIAEILYPKEFAQCVKDQVSFKKRYASTLYQWIKNGNFSLIYGAGQPKADRTYHLKGAYKTIRKELPLIDQFMDQKHKQAKEYGYIETLGGYPLQVPTYEPHKAVNYFVQGSAGEAIDKAAVRAFDYLKEFEDYHLIMQVHDELLFDFPKEDRNSEVMAEVVRLMELSGDDFGFELPVETDIITDNWSNGKDITNELRLAV